MYSWHLRASTIALIVIRYVVGSPAGAEPPSDGTIAIESNGSSDGDASVLPFMNALGEMLAAKGFTILDDPGHAAYTADLVVSRTDVGSGSARISSGGPSLGASGAGPGVVIPLPTGASKVVPLQRIQMQMRLRRRGEDTVLWKGGAVTVREAGTRKGANDVIAADLSEALLRSYPAEAEDIVGVP